MKRIILLIGLLALAFGGLVEAWADAPAEEPGYTPMSAAFSSPEAAFGEQVVLKLGFTLPDGARLDDPPKLDDVDESQLMGVKNMENGLELTLLVNTLDSFKVDALRLAYKTEDGATHWFESAPIEIAVNNGLPEDPSQLHPRPIKGLVPGKPFYVRYAPHLAVGLLAVALAMLLTRLYLKRRQGEAAGPPVAPPHEIALNDLDNLEEWWTDFDDPKSGYFRLSLIIRSYMGAIRPFPAADLTTEEIRSLAVEAEDRDMLPLLAETDMIKFAKASVAEETRKGHIAQARGYVHKTMPMEETGEVVEAEPVNDE